MKHDVTLDVFKGWGILFIVLGHIAGAGSLFTTGASLSFCNMAYKYLYSFHVPLFFFIAGMTFREKRWGEFFKSKFFRLLVPYFVFGMFSVLLYWAGEPFFSKHLIASDMTGFYTRKTDAFPIGKALLNLLLGGWWELGFLANSVLWFIPALFSVECAAQAVSRAAKKRWMWVLIAVCFWAVQGCGFCNIRLPCGLSLLPAYFPYLAAGMIWGLRGFPATSRLLLFFAGGLLILAAGVLSVMNPVQFYPASLADYARNTVLTFGSIFGWLLISHSLPCRGLAQCGVWSLGIMLIHKFPVLFFQNFVKPIRLLFMKGIAGTLCGIALVLVLAMGCSCLACWGILKTMPVLLGQKKGVGKA